MKFKGDYKIVMEDYVEKAQSFLELEHKIIGIKFLNSKDDYNKEEANTVIKNPIRYCVAVKSAMRGHSIKFNYKNSECSGSTRALGLRKLGESYYESEEGLNLGLYKDEEISSKVTDSFCVKKTSTYGVLIKPLEYFEDRADVVLIVASSYNAMRIIQGYTYTYGIENGFCLSGNQAICVECTMTPYITNKINISLLCSGTRYFAKWKEDDIAIGIPFEKFKSTIDGILASANAVEPDYKKSIIKEKLKNKKREFSLEFGKTYYK